MLHSLTLSIVDIMINNNKIINQKKKSISRIFQLMLFSKLTTKTLVFVQALLYVSSEQKSCVSHIPKWPQPYSEANNTLPPKLADISETYKFNCLNHFGTNQVTGNILQPAQQIM